jgi:hypothetical protein
VKVTAKIIPFPTRRDAMRKIDPELLALMMKHHRLIHNARQRGYSDKAIAALVKAAEDAKR